MNLALESTFADELVGAYTPHVPSGFPKPETVVFNVALAAELGLPQLSVERAAKLLSGSEVLDGWLPLSQAYAGHQFGGFSPQLGDGRAVLLGEWVTPDGQRVDIHLKGSGPTPFSRGGDGRATLAPALREYLIGEAMHHLGISTTRVLAVVRTGETVMRTSALPGAVLARVASSHLRVGTLQYFAVRRKFDLLRRIVAYTLQRHYPDDMVSDNPAVALLHAVARRQGKLIASWMHVGFIHGVMNTDNMALSGQTIDYGPCAFIDTYDPATTFSSIDHHGRYAYGNQPDIGQWNLARMGEALLPLLDEQQSKAIEHVEAALETYAQSYREHFTHGMRRKLGLKGEAPDDVALIVELLSWMESTQQDFTQTFRRLARWLKQGDIPENDEGLASWFRTYIERVGDDPATAVASRMNAENPIYIPRNHLVEEALDAAVAGDIAPFEALLDVLKTPFEERALLSRYTEGAPEDFGPYQTFCGT